MEKCLTSVQYLGILAKVCWMNLTNWFQVMHTVNAIKNEDNVQEECSFHWSLLKLCIPVQPFPLSPFLARRRESISTAGRQTLSASCKPLLPPVPQIYSYQWASKNAELIAPHMLFKYLCTLLAALSRKLGAVPQAWTQPVPMLKMTLIQDHSWYQCNANCVPCSVPKTDANRSKALGGWDLVYWFLTPH